MKKKLPRYKADISLFGDINDKSFETFLKQFEIACDTGDPILLELTTLGGEADVGRRIALDIKLARELHEKELYFFGKTNVYSVGVVIMSAFPKEFRFLARGTRLMVHERRIEKEVVFCGALSSCIQTANELLSQFEEGSEMAEEDFRDLIAGSALTLEELLIKAKSNWYLTAEEALELGLIEGIV